VTSPADELRAAEQNCWKLMHPGGIAYEGDFYDGERHFLTRDDALRALPDGSDATPVQLDRPCLHVDCAHCGTRLDEDDENHIFHFDSREEALAFARGFGWTVRGDGAWCPAEECTAASLIGGQQS
jgi:hypothetical protein